MTTVKYFISRIIGCTYGTAVWTPMAQFNSYCKPDVMKFPYDKQNCGLNFIAWTHAPHAIAFKYPTANVKMDFFHENGIWIISAGVFSLGLKQNLLKEYDPHVRGKTNQSESTYLETSFYPYNLNIFDEVYEVFSISGIFYIYWTDERMVWNPQDYNGTSMVSFVQTEVWTPNIVLADSNDDREVLHLGNDWMYVRFMSNGTAVWTPMAQFNSYCKPDVIKFPYDKQKCGLNFIAWTHAPHEITFKYPKKNVNMDFYHENGIWIINAGSLSSWFALINGERRELMVVTFYLERRANFFLMNLILPLTVMNILNVLVFFLSPSSGERVSFSITVLLAICVYMTIVTNNIPKTSSPGISFLCTKCLVDMIISSFVVLCTIIGLRLYESANDVVTSKLIMFLTKCILHLYCNRKKRFNNSEKVTEFESSDEKSFPSKASIGDDVITWNDVGKASDIVFFLVCFISFAMSDILFFAYVQ